MNRRGFLSALSAVPLVGLQPLRVAAEYRVGTKTVTSVSDGNLVLPGDMVFDGLPQDELAAILEQYGISREQILPPCNLTLLQDGERTILFDAGSGSAFMPSAGEILESLDAVGVAPEDVTHVVFTHAHPDHLWGVLDDFDDPVFYDAEHLISQPEWDYWTDPDTVNTIDETRASFAVGAARRLDAIADQMSFFEDQDEVLPGVLAHLTPGHTPGHTSFEIRDGKNALMVVGDAIVNHHVAFARPDWPSGTDQDQETGAQTRMKLLDRLVADDIALLGFHLPKGGVGRVERAGTAYNFVAKGD